MAPASRLFRLASTREQAASRYLVAATGPVDAGGFYYEGKLRPPPVQADDEQFAGELRAALASTPGLAARRAVPALA